MSKFLWRGYNVAIPAVDVGEDVFVVEATTDENRGMLRRVQVKTAAKGTKKDAHTAFQFSLSRAQLKTTPIYGELYYMLIARWQEVDPAIEWRFVLIPRKELFAVLEAAVEAQKNSPGRGRPLSLDNSSDQLTIKVQFSSNDVHVWGQSIKKYVDQWSEEWAVGSPMRGLVAVTQPWPAGSVVRSPAPSEDHEKTR